MRASPPQDEPQRGSRRRRGRASDQRPVVVLRFRTFAKSGGPQRLVHGLLQTSTARPPFASCREAVKSGRVIARGEARWRLVGHEYQRPALENRAMSDTRCEPPESE